MAIFLCKFGGADSRIMEKEFEAANAQVLRQSLEEQGFFIFELRKKPFQFLYDKGFSSRKVSTKDLLTFNQELLVLLKAGLPIVQAFDTILERLDKGKLGETLTEVRTDIKQGSALSDALERHAGVFSHLYIASIRAGERTGDLPKTIRRYIAFLKRVEGFRKKLISAFIYPAILIVVAVLAVTMLLVYVVPTFSQVYADAGSQLPLPTQILIAVTSTLRRYFFLFIAAMVAGGILFRRWSATIGGRYRTDGWKLKIPLLGTIFTKYAIAGFTRTLATVLGSGIPIVESLKMAVGTLNNRVLERKLLTAIGRVEEGVNLSSALESEKFMPALALRMLGVGETTGSLEEMLGDISDYFEEEIDQSLQILTTAIEPAIMVVMGLVIGTIIITMYLPVFKLAGAMG